jgi:hypothetical protein
MQIVDMHLGRIGVSASAGWTNRFIRHWLLEPRQRGRHELKRVVTLGAEDRRR